MVAAGMAGHLGLAMMTIAQHAQAARKAKEKADLLEQAGLKASARHVRARQELHEGIVRRNANVSISSRIGCSMVDQPPKVKP